MDEVTMSLECRINSDKSLIKHLVVDSGAFMRNAKLENIGKEIYTLQEVVNEIRDKATKQRLQVLPYELKFRTPSAEDISLVSEFSKKTGDYPSLSATDIKVLALAYLIHKEICGIEKLRKEPLKANKVLSSSIAQDVGQNIVGFYVPNDSNEVEAVSEELSSLRLTQEQLTEVDDEEDEDSGHSSESDDEDTWITPENLDEARRKMGVLDTSQSDVDVACLTTDFAMQNVLIQMGISVVSLDGLLITTARTYILRCYGCFTTTSVMTKQFCPKCGNKTLKRVAVSVSDDGTKTVGVNFRRPINIRGTRYSLPMPKGGKHSRNPILCEDQPLPQNRASKVGTDTVDIFDPAFEVRSSPFALNDIYTRAGKLGIRNKATSRHRSNPNSNGIRTGNKRNKKKTV